MIVFVDNFAYFEQTDVDYPVITVEKGVEGLQLQNWFFEGLFVAVFDLLGDSWEAIYEGLFGFGEDLFHAEMAGFWG